MSDAATTDEALDGLSELAACDLRLAKRFAARIEALPEDADDRANALARSYQRMARSYRQSVALQLRFRRDLAAEARAEAGGAEKAHADAVFQRKCAIKARLRTLIYDEREFERAEAADAFLPDLIAAAAEDPDFLDTPLDRQVEMLLPILDRFLDDPAGPAPSEPAPQPAASSRLAPPMDLPSWHDEDSS